MPQFEHGLQESLGVLVVNLGTPDAPTPPALRRYLKQFLADPRVVELPRWLWRLVLTGYILRVRPARSAALYRRIWTEQGSPLLLHSKAVAEAMQEQLSARLPGTVHVELAMSYGNPSIASTLQILQQQNARRVVVLPLYPQYSGSTTGSVFDAVSRTLSTRRWVPEFRFINHYHDTAGYIAALAASIREFRNRHGAGERLLFSFHGLPCRMVDAGDPYHDHCQTTARLVARSLELRDAEWQIGFQSRVGRQEWLRPYTDETLQQWGHAGMDRVDVICPGFAVDCLETLEEIAMRYSELFTASGGGELRYIPALNASDDHVAFLSRLIEENVGGWPEASADPGVSLAADDRNERAERARDIGAIR